MLNMRLFWQMAITIAILILGIESVFLYFSVDAKRAELLEIRQDLDADAIATTNKTFNQLHPGILNDADIERRARAYRSNIIQMTILLTLVVVAGALIIFYLIALKPLRHLIFTIRTSKAPNLLRFKGKIPRNEIGELIMARERQLDLIADYQRKLEGQVDELRREVIQSEKLSMLGELSAGIIHDLNNPLQLIIFNLDDLTEQLESDTPDCRYAMSSVDELKYAAHKIQGLINRMTGFVRKSTHMRTSFDIAEAIADAVALMSSRLQKSGIRPEVTIDERLECHGYRQDIEQTLANLISNGIDAMEDVSNRRLQILARAADDDWIEVVVKDNGQGIEKDAQEDIFTSLYTTKPEGKGTGLGLSNVARIVADHNGKVSVNSQPGKGAEFRIILPGRTIGQTASST